MSGPDAVRIAWTDGRWTRRPHEVTEAGSALRVTAIEGSDAWRRTAYGFVHDNPHALLAPLTVGSAMEVTFRTAWSGQFDQAGLFIRVDDTRWTKAGVEFADGSLGLGAVVTDGMSDWSIGSVDEWMTDPITVRVSRWTDALIVRARTPRHGWRLVRVAPLAGDLDAEAGPFLCAPTRAGLEVSFTSWVRTSADDALH